MALPVHLRDSVTPQELEMIACQQLIEIVPLIAMEKTAFISVSATLHNFSETQNLISTRDYVYVGCIWSSEAP
jgi:hypothetical protein